MINPKCSRCGKELEADGGIIISPPSIIHLGHTVHTETIWRKLHVCMDCWPDLEQLMVTPHGSVQNMVGVCQDLLKLDGYISMHVSFAKDWEPLVARARKAITYKGGGTIRP